MPESIHLIREDNIRVRLENTCGVEATLFARPEVPIQDAAVAELGSLLETQRTVERLAEMDQGFFGDERAQLVRVAVTPDFHKGSGIPIGTVIATRGFVIPQAIGNDVNCGMRLHTTGYTAEQVRSNLDALETKLRHLFFQGGRDLPMTSAQRESLFRDGLPGLFESLDAGPRDGLWAFARQLKLDHMLQRVDRAGRLPATAIPGLEDFVAQTRDGQIGSIGGGNHFVELQVIERIFDGTTAHPWGLSVGQVVIMVHAGSVMIGHLCGTRYRRIVKEIYPDGAQRPDNGICLLPNGGEHAATVASFRDSLHNAANVAFGNRMCLAVMALKGLEDVCGPAESELLYDSPHNLVWEELLDGEPVWVHRKGACRARGLAEMADTEFAYYGEPVLIPGSMGASSFILAGMGNAEALWSASHGAGRRMSRGKALKHSDEEFQRFLEEFRVVIPVDLRSTEMKQRPDIAEQRLAELKKEAPFAYKGIGDVIRTVQEAGMARPVAEVRPLMTLKG